ncbi:Hsp20/alpha crystallin family protein [Tepidibacter aestuarii]|uniref:Hsp20/alpha crystallin family protein n=1 Tax=Tepidibacter aestuarii TaxID=2925782 RepID=UPI0020C09FE3|nr:Hsp20/alpha crystallin family protein [Tepidibacter aestuarii]CAH2215420.1 HSP20 family protein [Tepidibacter aestuarii]
MFGLTPFNRNSVQKRNGNFVDFYNIIDDFFNDAYFPVRNLQDDTFKMDVKETSKEYLIEAEVPGLKKEEINVDYNDNRLLISVQKDEQINEEKGNYIHKERRSSEMRRSVYLKDVKRDSITAKLENGILKITAPKTEIIENRYKIEIE